MPRHPVPRRRPSRSIVTLCVSTERPSGTSLSPRHMVIGSVMDCGNRALVSRASEPLGEPKSWLM
jgi:hypothetical protein